MAIQNAGDLAVANFTSDFREMLLSFEEADWGEALASWLRTEGTSRISPGDDETDFEILVEQGFSELYRRSAIAPVRPFSTAGEQQAVSLLRLYSPKDPEKSSAVPKDPLADVVDDFNGRLSTSEFKQRCQKDPAYFALYEKAIAAGRI